MENKTVESVPYLVHESILARLTAEYEKERAEREKDRQDKQDTIKKLWITIIILIFLCVASNAGWIYYESQFVEEETSESYEAVADDGGVAVANGSGEVTYNG